MAKDFVQVAPDGAGARIDTRSFDRAGTEIEQQIIGVGDGTDSDPAKIATAAPGGADPGLVVRNIPSGTQPVSAAALPLPAGAATEVTLAALLVDLAALLARLPAALGAPGGGLKVEGVAGATAVPVSAATLPLPADAATQTTLAALNAKVPAAPAAEHTAAATPSSTRLSDGAAFYKPTTPTDTQPVSLAAPVTVQDGGGSLTVDSAQLPAALGGGGGLKVDVVSGGGGSSTQYTEGDVDASITGGAVLWEDAGDTLRAVSAAKPLPVGVQGTVPVSVAAAVTVQDGGGSVTVDGSVSLAAAIPAGNNNIGDVDVATMPASSRTADTVCASQDGKYIVVDGVACEIKRATINLAATGDLVAAVTSKKIRVLAAVLNVNVDGTWSWRDNTTVIGAAWTLRAGSGFVLPFAAGGWVETTSGNKLSAALATITQASGFLEYAEV